MASSLKKVFQNVDISLSVLQVVASNSYDSILITDATKDAKIIYANKAFTTLTGYDQSEVIGKTPKILGLRVRVWVILGHFRGLGACK